MRERLNDKCSMRDESLNDQSECAVLGLNEYETVQFNGVRSRRRYIGERMCILIHMEQGSVD